MAIQHLAAKSDFVRDELHAVPDVLQVSLLGVGEVEKCPAHLDW
jgi:hypothetical protein